MRGSFIVCYRSVNIFIRVKTDCFFDCHCLEYYISSFAKQI